MIYKVAVQVVVAMIVAVTVKVALAMAVHCFLKIYLCNCYTKIPNV